MKLDALTIHDQPPLKCFEVENLSDVVVIAGPNGVGKTRLMNAILSVLRNPARDPSKARLIVSATHERERAEWGADTLDTSVPDGAAKLSRTLQKRQRRGNQKSSALQFDSTRQFAQVQPLQWQWNFVNPTDEEIGWDFLFNPFQQRFQDTIHAIYKMLGHHRATIARNAIDLQRAGKKSMDLDFPDPLTPFREAFAILLGPKTLADIDITNPEIRYIEDGATLGIESLSSGEKEAFNIVFDLLLRGPEDCIILFDEPELHLHPELSFRLLKTLQVVGSRNQFVLFTHSADIISSAIEHSVVFIAPKSVAANQAVPVRATDDTVAALRQLGQGLGIISLGRRIVLIEGVDSSIDRDTYGSIIQGRFPSLVLAPSGSRGTIISFNQIVQDVLQRTLWGVDFFMLADRDNSLPDSYLSELESRAAGRLRFLMRLHIENYFLDENTLATAFEDLAPKSDWRRQPAAIRERLHSLAQGCIPLAVNRWLSTQLRSLVGELDVSAKGINTCSQDQLLDLVTAAARHESERISQHLASDTISAQLSARWAQLEASLNEGDQWKRIFPGKILFGQFAGACGLRSGMLRSAYLAASRRTNFAAFQDVLDIFSNWVQ